MNVRLHIQRLTLDGLPLDAGQGPAVRAAVEAELKRLIAERGIGPALERGGALAYVRGGELDSARGDTPASLGEKIGRVVHGGIQP